MHPIDLVTEEEIRTAWLQACSEHLQSSLLFQLAADLAEPSLADARHLGFCSKCRSVYNRYKDGLECTPSTS